MSRRLGHAVRFTALSDKAAAILGWLDCDPIMDASCPVPEEAEVVDTHGFLEVRRPGATPVKGNISALVGHIMQSGVNQSLADHADAPVIKGACLVGAKRRVMLIAGDPGVTVFLAMALMSAGFHFEGAYGALVRQGAVTAFPRKPLLSEQAVHRLPAVVQAQFASALHFIDWHGNKQLVGNPHLPGDRWRIGTGPVADFVFVESNAGGRSVMSPIGTEEGFRRLVAHTYLPPPNQAAAAFALHRVFHGARSHRLQFGDLQGALWHLERFGAC